MSRLLGGIEAGGTKFVCAVGTGPGDVRAELRFPTTGPDETLGRAIEFFRQAARRGPGGAGRRVLRTARPGPRLADLRPRDQHAQARLGRTPISPARWLGRWTCRWASTPTSRTAVAGHPAAAA